MRSQEFGEAADGAREEPQFSTVQQQSPHGYVPSSTLAQLFPGVNGLGPNDYERRMVGFGGTPLGTSEDTFKRNLWLNRREPTARLDTVEG